MPRRKAWHVESLVQKCLRSIAKVLSNNNNENVQVTTKEKSRSHHRVFPPFDKWPLQLSEQVIKFLWDNDQLHVCHRDLLVNKQTKRLDLSFVTGISAENAAASFVEVAAMRCPDLSHLFLSEVMFTLNQFYKFLPLFKQLRVLDVESTKFNDAGLYIIAAHCKNLRELNVSGCDVSNEGIGALCGGQSVLRKSIQVLRIVGTKVTQKGIETALRRLPRLKNLVHPLVMETLADMAQNDHSTRQGRKYRLLHLDFSLIEEDPWGVHDSQPYQTGVLNMAALLCPSVTHVNITDIFGLADSDFLGLVALGNLTNLKISNPDCRNCHFTFDGSLAPLLKARGRSLNSLKLERLNISVRLGVVVKYCPNLQVLSLDCDYSTSFWPEDDLQQAACKRAKMNYVFKHLEELKFSGGICREPPPLEEFLSAVPPSLKTLVIRKCSSFDDQLLLKVFDSFKVLEQLELHHCRLTKGVIERVLFEENCLKMFSISVNGRDSVSFDELTSMSTEAENNWDLKFRYRTEHFGYSDYYFY